MKNIKAKIILVIAICFARNAQSQNLNWGNLKTEDKHLANINMGYEYGAVIGAAYGYHLKTKLPTVLNVEFSIPAGDNLLDDFKTKIGGQIRLYEIHNFCFTANVHGVFRRFENPMARMLNFGSDFSGVIGYYKPKWFAAGEVGFDKAIVTHFKSSDMQREFYPGIQDGWYQPATGGNFYYGLQTGYSFKQSEITLSIGKTVTQDFKTAPLIPFYFNVGYNFKIK